MVKMIWALIGLNSLALLIFVGAYFIYNSGRQVSYEERAWTTVLSITMLAFLLLAAIPLFFSQGKGSEIFSGIVATLPWLIAVAIALVK